MKALVLAVAFVAGALDAQAATVETATGDVRACLVRDDGVVLAGTDGGLVEVGADGRAHLPLTALDGLPATRVHALAGDGRGVWVATDGGVARVLDRKVVAAHPGASARALALHSGALYVGTWGDGLWRIVGDGTRARVGGGRQRISALAVHRGVLYAGTQTGVARLDGDGLRLLPRGALPSPVVWALASTDDGLAVGTLRGVVILDRQETRRLAGDVDARALATVDGRLRIATFGEGLATRAGDALAYPRGPAATFTQAVASRGAIACVGAREGLFVRRDGNWAAVALGSLPSNDIAALAVDARGTVWAGTFDAGLARRDGDRWRRVEHALLDARINTLLADGDRLWVGTLRGLVRLDAERTTRFAEADGLPSSEILALTRLADGAILVGTHRGAAILRDATIETLGDKQGLPGGAVFAVAQTSDGTLWLGTSRGLYRGAGDSFTRLSTITRDLEDDWVTALTSDGKTLYAGTYAGGVTRLTPNHPPEHLGGGSIHAIALDRKRLLAATQTGLIAIPDGTRLTPGEATSIAATPTELLVATRAGLVRLPR